MAYFSLQSLVERLDRIAPNEIEVARVQEIVADGTLEEATLRPFIGTFPDRYARRRVHRGPLFEVLVLTWAPGQFTPVHNHAGNLGWVRLVRGQISEETFSLVPGTAAPTAGLVADPSLVPGKVCLEQTSSAVHAAIGAVATADRVRAIHRLGNPAAAHGDTTVTLHVYSLPHDHCLQFDLATRTCQRRALRLDPQLQ